MSLYHLYVPPSCCRQQPGGFLLLKLDQAIKERPIYMEQKELKLVELKRQLHRQIPDEERFVILGTLLDEYRSFNTDSALHMAEEREQIAIRLGNREYIDNARMNKADVLGMTGMYKEVMDLMRNIHIDRLPVDIHPYYYHIYVRSMALWPIMP